ncbi:hypothetical protein DUI87_02279 [Hirundo rustica rustica]|uniref:ribonuclease H n=1 Tax=Hirundo rustica rustica TaxID=333673 RepID=A0A3M0LBV5_HIRRU|nr:hypothetical protein DUI87_02279 [Hirundo rustica rustica]
MVYKKLIKILEFVLGMFSLWFFRPTLRPSSSSMFWGFINNCTQFVRGGVGDEALQPLLSFFSFESVTSLLENVQRLLNVKDTTFLVFHLVTFLYMVYSFSRMSHTPLNTAGQQIEAREQGDKSVTQAAANPTAIQAAAKPDSEAKTPAVAAVKKGKKHTDKTNRPVDDDSGEGSSMPPDTQSGVKPPDTQSEAEATDDTQSEAEPTDTKSEAKSTGTRSGVQPTSTQSGAQPAATTSGAQPTAARAGARPTAARAGDTIESFSLKDLRGLRKDYTRRPDESIISWLVRLWDAAGEATILDGTEARHLGSLSHDPVIDQEMMREASPCSLWERVLGSVAQRYLCADDLYMQQTQWKTIEQGIQRLREMAVAEIVFSDDINTRNPDLVPCTPVMWRKLVRLGPQEYSSALAIMKRDETEETVLDMAKKLRTYADAVHGPTHARIAALETQVEARENRVFWTVWIRWPGTSEPQKYEALVDTGAQCTLLPSRHVGEESVSIAGVTGGSQDFTLVEADVSLTGNEWKRHPIVTGPEAPCILGIDFLRNGYFKDPKGFRWAFGVAAVETEGVKQLNTLPGLSENPSAVGLLRVEEQQVPIATSTVHRRQYRTTRDAVIPIHEMIRELETQGVVSKTHSPFNSPIWPVRKSDGEWRLTVDYRALNEVTPPLSAAVPDMLELQYELESKAAKWYATIDIANAFFSIPLAAECRPQFAFTWRGVQYTWNRLPQGWKHSPTICHGLIQAALEKGEAPEHLQYIDDIIVWGNTAMEVFEKGEKIIQILLKAGFAIKKSKVKGPAREIQFLGVKWHDGRRQIPTEVINKITAMCPPTNKKETQAFLGAIGFWRMHIPEYSQIVSPLYLVTRKKNDFHWGPEQQQAFAQIKQEIAHAVALGPVRTDQM